MSEYYLTGSAFGFVRKSQLCKVDVSFCISTTKNMNSCCFISLLAFGISLLNLDCSVRYLMASYCLYSFFSKERGCWISCRKIVFHMYLFCAFKVFCPLYCLLLNSKFVYIFNISSLSGIANTFLILYHQ